jgi:hypothetical protein
MFKNKNWASAAELYSDAIASAVLADDKLLTAQCYCNRAAALFMTGDMPGCTADCTAALELEPEYFKAIKRRADAAEKSGDLHACVRDLFSAIRASDPRYCPDHLYHHHHLPPPPPRQHDHHHTPTHPHRLVNLRPTLTPSTTSET